MCLRSSSNKTQQGYKVDEPALEQQPAIAATSSASAETTATASLVVTLEESDRSDATFDPEQEVMCSTEGVLEQDWLLTLDRDNIISLSLFLMYNFRNLLSSL